MIYVDKAFGDAVINGIDGNGGNGFHPNQNRDQPWAAVLEVISVHGHVAAGLIDTGEPIPDDNDAVPDETGALEFVASHRVLWRAPT